MGERDNERRAFESVVKRVMEQGKAVGGTPSEKQVRDYVREKVIKPLEGPKKKR